MADSSIWWLLTGVAVAAELMTGTFYLLMFALGLAAAAIKSAEFNSDVNMDIGQTIYIEAWQADGTANVKYRGSNWIAQLQAGSEPAAGNYIIEQVIGSRFIVKKI